jgi:hypothetical protein
MNRRETKNALAAKAADAKKAAALKDAGLSENATAAEVVRLFKSTAADVEKTAREGMKRLAELAGLLVEGYGFTQEQVAEKVSRSQPWVSQVLKWRREGYKQVAFGPETRSAPKLLAANNSADTSNRTATIRTTAGDKLDPSPLRANASEQLAKQLTGSAVTEIPVEARKAVYNDKPHHATVHVEPVATDSVVVHVDEARPPEPPRELTAEEKSHDALTAFKKACETYLPLVSDADLKKARIYFMEGKWKPRPIRKAA